MTDMTEPGPAPARVRFHEGSIPLPEGFEDRTTNLFVPPNPQQAPSLSIARDWMQDQEPLSDYVERQLGRLKKHMAGYKLLSRGEARLGQGETALPGWRVDAQYKSGAQPVFQRQAVFEVAPSRALIFTASSARPFDEHANTLWRTWLEAFAPAADGSQTGKGTNPAPDAAPPSAPSRDE